jgi:hypothetical protein
MALFLAGFGLVIALLQFLPGLGKGVPELLGGLLCFAMDVGARKALKHQSLLNCDGGGRLLLIPLWIWGIWWIFLGLGKALWAMLT